MTCPSLSRHTARVLRSGGRSGSAKARSSAAASCGLCRRDDGEAAMSGSSAASCFPAAAPRCRRPRAVIEITTEALAAIDGVALAEPQQRHGDILARAVDAVVHRPRDQSGARHRREWSPKIPAPDRRPETKVSEQTTFATKPVATFRHVAGPRGRQRQRAERRGGGEDQEQFSSGHRTLRHDASARAGH